MCVSNVGNYIWLHATDGGHYSNWDFDSETIIKYLAAVAATKINLIEIRC